MYVLVALRITTVQPAIAVVFIVVLDDHGGEYEAIPPSIYLYRKFPSRD